MDKEDINIEACNECGFLPFVISDIPDRQLVSCDHNQQQKVDNE